MILRWLVAALHLLALGLGLGGIWARGRALSGHIDRAALIHAFDADNWWGVAAFIWISTGLVRAFSSLEKGRDYYMHNAFFHAKMGLFLIVFALEIRPMILLIKWRAIVRKGGMPDTHAAHTLSRISEVQAVLIVFMVICATAMARGLGAF